MTGKTTANRQAGAQGPAATKTTPKAQRSSAPRGSLAISRPHDAAEVEAERTAQRVLRMAAPPAARKEDKKHKGKLLRLAAPAAGFDERRQYAGETVPGTATLHRDSGGHAGGDTRGGGTVTAAEGAAISGLRGGGAPLDAASRDYFEPLLGADLSPVRVHTSDMAAELAAAFQARAFRVGNDIAFGAGQYRPGTADGRRVLAHELAHASSGNPHVARAFYLAPLGTPTAHAGFDTPARAAVARTEANRGFEHGGLRAAILQHNAQWNALRHVQVATVNRSEMYPFPVLAEQRQLNPFTLHIDHVVPWGVGGGSVGRNARVVAADQNMARRHDGSDWHEPVAIYNRFHEVLAGGSTQEAIEWWRANQGEADPRINEMPVPTAQRHLLSLRHSELFPAALLEQRASVVQARTLTFAPTNAMYMTDD